MIYAASFFEPTNHHGELIGISRSLPQSFQGIRSLSFLAPSKELLSDWKHSQMDEADYTNRFRAELGKRWSQIQPWLQSLQPQKDATLLCWERAGEFCHRNLVVQMLTKHRPDCIGGADIPVIQASSSFLQCPQCNCTVVPGLDFSLCNGCQTWIRTSKID